MTQILDREATRMVPPLHRVVEIRPSPRRGLRWMAWLVVVAIVITVGILMSVDDYSAPTLVGGAYVTTGVRFQPQPYPQVEPTLGL